LADDLATASYNPHWHSMTVCIRILQIVPVQVAEIRFSHFTWIGAVEKFRQFSQFIILKPSNLAIDWSHEEPETLFSIL